MYKLINDKLIFTYEPPEKNFLESNIPLNKYKWYFAGTFDTDVAISCPGGCTLPVTLVNGDYFKCKKFEIKTEEGNIYMGAHV